MIPFLAFAMMLAPALPPPSAGLWHKYAVIDRYAGLANYNPFVARRQIMAESSMGRYLEAWRWVKVKHKWRLKLISRGAAMLSVKDEREHVEAAGLDYAKFNWRDFDQSVRVGMALMGRLLSHYHGDVRLALAAYNAGALTVDRWRAWPAETREYVRRVTE